MARLDAEFRRRFKPGYRFSSSGKKGHLYILDPNGDIVRRTDGRPFTMPTSSNTRGPDAKVLEKRLRDCGVIE